MKDISLSAAAGTAKYLKGLAKQVGTKRRTYVDPHIRKIWEKVEENATAKTTMATPAPVDILPKEETESTITASLVTDEVTIPLTNVKEPDTLPNDVPVPEEDAQDVLHPMEPTPPPLASAPPSPLHATSTQEAAQSAVNIAEASAHGVSTVLYELEKEVETLGSTVAEMTIRATVENSEPQPEQTEVVQAVEAKLHKEEISKQPGLKRTEVISTESVAEVSIGGAASGPSPSGAAPGGVIGVGASSPDSTLEAEDDLDDFLRDIGLHTSSAFPSPSPTTTQLSEADEAAASASAQESYASHLASIASKRLAITTRHAAFETDLQSSILTSTSQIIEKLTEMREFKKEELSHMIEGEAGFVAELTMSGDKLMKGLDVYLKKCQGRSGTWKQRGVVGNDHKGEDDDDIQKRTGIAKDEQARLESVIEKMEIKFLDGVQKVQEQVNEWYLGMIEKEQEEVGVAFFLSFLKLTKCPFLKPDITSSNQD